MSIARFHRLQSLCWYLAGFVLTSIGGSAATAQQAMPANPPSAPTGVTPLPTSPPPTNLQAPVPAPIHPLPEPAHPQKVSPTLQQVEGRVPPHPITLQQAVAIGLANSRALALAVEALQQAHGRTVQARDAFNPTLTGQFTFTHLDAGQSFKFGQQTITIVNQDQRQLQAVASLPIDITGLLHTAKDQAQFEEIAARISVNQTQNDTVLAIKNAFYNVLRAKALVVVAKETLQNDIDRLADAQKKLKAGTAAPFDVLSAQTEVANAQQQLIAAQSNVSLAIAQLNSALGIAIDTPLEISDAGAVENPPDVPPPSALQQLGNLEVPQNMETDQAAHSSLNLGSAYDALVQEALKTRPEVLAADAQLAAARKGILLAQKSYLPSVAVSAQVTYSPDAAGFAPKTTSGALVLSVSIPLYDGGQASAQLEQARALVAQAETQRRNAIDQVELDVRSAYLNLLQARDRVAVANQALAEARESYRLATVRYTSGVSPILEVSNAQAALTQAEQNQVNALYDYNNARAALDRAVGRYSYTLQSAGYQSQPSPPALGLPTLPTGGSR